MGAAGAVRKAGNGEIIAVSHLKVIFLNAGQQDEGIQVTIPQTTDKNAFCSIKAQIQLAKILLHHEQDVR